MKDARSPIIQLRVAGANRLKLTTPHAPAIHRQTPASLPVIATPPPCLIARVNRLRPTTDVALHCWTTMPPALATIGLPSRTPTRPHAPPRSPMAAPPRLPTARCYPLRLLRRSLSPPLAPASSVARRLIRPRLAGSLFGIVRGDADKRVEKEK